MLICNKKYLALAASLLIIEVLIALYVHDEIIRPYGGDFLVVILLYCFLKSFITIKTEIAGIIVLVFAYFIETMQYFNIVDQLGLQNNSMARTIIGTFFTFTDILAYTLGTLFILFTEHIIKTLKLRYLFKQKIDH
jgi:hypothetical protein